MKYNQYTYEHCSYLYRAHTYHRNYNNIFKKTSREAVTSNTSWYQARIISSMKRSLSRNSKTSITLLTRVEFFEDKTNQYNYTFFTSRLSWSQVKINTIFSLKKIYLNATGCISTFKSKICSNACAQTPLKKVTEQNLAAACRQGKIELHFCHKPN